MITNGQINYLFGIFSKENLLELQSEYWIGAFGMSAATRNAVPVFILSTR